MWVNQIRIITESHAESDVLRELTGVREVLPPTRRVKLSFGHIRWLCSDEAKTACAEFDDKYKKALKRRK